MFRLSRSTNPKHTPVTQLAGARPTQRIGKRNRRRGMLVAVGVLALIAVLFNAFVTWLGKENWTMLPI